MNIQKIQTSQNVAGFTLVELIVVITILVILGTIAFLNLGGVSASARDSQRTSDLGQINTQIMVSQAKQGLTYTSMVTANTIVQLATPSIAGTGATLGTNYFAGDVNYTVLGVDQNKFQDPTSKVAYKMGVTSLVGTAYELAASLEETKTALVMGTFRSRTAASTSNYATGTAGVLTFTGGLGTYKLNDYIGNGTQSGTITSISSDLTKITINNSSAAAGTYTLAVDETKGLMGSGAAANVITNKGTNLPY